MKKRKGRVKRCFKQHTQPKKTLKYIWRESFRSMWSFYIKTSWKNRPLAYMKNVAFTLLLVGDQHNLFFVLLNVSTEFDDVRPIFFLWCAANVFIGVSLIALNAKTIPIWRCLCVVYEMDIRCQLPPKSHQRAKPLTCTMCILRTAAPWEKKQQQKHQESQANKSASHFMFCTWNRWLLLPIPKHHVFSFRPCYNSNSTRPKHR